jgi:hypothetical protein
MLAASRLENCPLANGTDWRVIDTSETSTETTGRGFSEVSLMAQPIG